MSEAAFRKLLADELGLTPKAGPRGNAQNSVGGPATKD